MGENFFANFLNFTMFWGIWLLAPLMFDVSTAVIYLVTLYSHRPNKDEEEQEQEAGLSYYPPVTIVVPVHDSANTLEKCLTSIAEQSYPVHYIQVICANNGSTDHSFEVFQRFQYEHQEMALTWTSLERSNKSIALNAGIYSGQGSYLINVDSDTYLDKEAVMEIVKAFEQDNDLVAVTATIRVNKTLGAFNSFLDLVNYCEVIEYLLAFDIGRRFQTLMNTLFTLSGAFSAFRRDVILQSYLYLDNTVSEDTDLTYRIRKKVESQKGKIGCVQKAIAYVEPIDSMSRLYSQRVRWQRGQIEVASTYFERFPNPWQALLDFTGRILILDHTLVFSRLAWTFLIPFLYFLGYSLPMVVISIIGLYVCYLLLDTLFFVVAYKGATKPLRQELRKIPWVVFFLPIYRYLSYWFRLSGVIKVLTEPKSWSTTNPITQAIENFKQDKEKLAKIMFRKKNMEHVKTDG